MEKFQSPCGEIVDGNDNALQLPKKADFVQFQSPCGEIVDGNVTWSEESINKTDVSVPLRGNG